MTGLLEWFDDEEEEEEEVETVETVEIVGVPDPVFDPPPEIPYLGGIIAEMYIPILETDNPWKIVGFIMLFVGGGYVIGCLLRTFGGVP